MGRTLIRTPAVPAKAWATGTIVILSVSLAFTGYRFFIALADRPMLGSDWLVL